MSDWLKMLKKKSEKRSEVFVVHSVEGCGKSSFASQFPGATFMFSENETGLLTLASRGLAPECPYFPEFELWTDVVDATDEMIVSEDRPKTLVVDTVNGIEALLHQYICNRDYNKNMSKKGFLAYGEGPAACIPVLREWVSKLDDLRNQGTTIVLLAHTKVSIFKNPEGTDYHRYVAELHDLTWAVLKKFADMVVFLNFNTVVTDETGDQVKRGKGTGGSGRVYQFQRTAAFDAKQRHGLPASMLGTGSAQGDFKAFCDLIKAGDLKTKAKPKETTAAA